MRVLSYGMVSGVSERLVAVTRLLEKHKVISYSIRALQKYYGVTLPSVTDDDSDFDYLFTRLKAALESKPSLAIIGVSKESHRTATRTRTRERYHRRISEGLCVMCGKVKPLERMTRCSKCRDVQNEYNRRRYLKAIDSKEGE